MVLRPYQQRAIAELRAVYASGKRAPCLVLPTGSGKTHIAAEVIRSAVARGNRVLFLAHRTELLDQSVAKLENAGITDLRLIRAAYDLGDPRAPVAVASVQTLVIPRWRGHLPEAGLVVFDEAHHVVAKTWAQLADAYRHAHLLGLTATPQRADGKPLGDVFDAIVVGATVAELTELGHLVPCKAWSPHNPLETGELAMDAVEAYLQHGQGQRAMVFCVTLEHAAIVAGEFNTRGIRADVVHGQLGAQDRADRLARFRSGETRVMANVHVLTEGFDDPGVAVCILTRKPQHVGTFLQMVGRVLRPAPDKSSAVLLDLCGSVLEHGLPETPRTYALDGNGIARQDDREPIRQCPSCGAVFLARDVCPMCGLGLPTRPRALPQSVGAGLAPVGSAAPRPPMTLTIAAKFPGWCGTCGGRVSVGERIRWAKGSRASHVDCVRGSEIDAINRALGGA